jgi:hypothetical protein
VIAKVRCPNLSFYLRHAHHHHTYPARLSTRTQTFIRTLLHTDYLAQKPTILLLQVEFLAAHPNQPFYVGFDYTDGRAVVRVYPLEDSGGRGAFLVINATTNT